MANKIVFLKLLFEADGGGRLSFPSCSRDLRSRYYNYDVVRVAKYFDGLERRQSSQEHSHRYDGFLLNAGLFSK